MIDVETLSPGTLVRLRFSYDREDLEDAVFLGVLDTEGPLRVARFCQAAAGFSEGTKMYTWSAQLEPDGMVLLKAGWRVEVAEVVSDFEI